MKILNNRVVCSGCEEPFELGQKFIMLQKKLVVCGGFSFTHLISGYPTTSGNEAMEAAEVFHEGCD